MTKLNYTRKEVEQLKEELFFSSDEELILILWLEGKSIVETSMLLNMSTATITRRRKSIRDKINKLYD